MSSFRIPYISPEARESAEKKLPLCSLTPWEAISAIYEVCEQHLIMNNPTDLGFPFTQKYDPDDTKSDITLDINYDWKANKIQKRPAIFITRGDVVVDVRPTIGQTIAVDPRNSTDQRISIMNMSVIVTTIASGIGFAEQFAEYVRYPFLYFIKEIEKNYCIQKLGIKTIGRPIKFESDVKNTFSIELVLDVHFVNIWGVHMDSLKLKTLAATMFVGGDPHPLQNQ